MSEKNLAGAILQRDKETYAFRPRMPLGLTTPDELENIAGLARKYDIPVLKISSGARMVLVGIKEDDVPSLKDDLGDASVPHKFYVQACPGNDWCKFGVQGSIEMGQRVDALLMEMGDMPAKIKAGVSGCGLCCAESWVRDFGLIGGPKGWKVVIGGNSGGKPAIAEKLADKLSDDEAFDLVRRFLEYYRDNAKPKSRVAKFVKETGIEAIAEALGVK